MLPVPHVVIFGELTPQAREQYARFLLERNVQVRERIRFAKRRPTELTEN
jgi:hypothetical protein